jgi:hypothetical protein
MSKKYRRVNERMKEAAVILVTFGWKADKFEELFGVSRSVAFKLAKEAREINAARLAEMERRAERERQEQDAVTAGSLMDSWQRNAKPLEPGLPLGNVRRFRA